MHGFKFYAGKGKSEFLPENIVLDLSQNLQHAGYHIFADSWHITVAILETREDGIAATGAIMSNRKGLPADSKQVAKSLQRGDAVFWRKKNLCLLHGETKKLCMLYPTILELILIHKQALDYHIISRK